MRFLVCLLVATALRLSCYAQTAYESACAELAAEKANDTERIHRFFTLNWEHTMLESPEFATYVGYPGQNGRWTDQSLEAIARRKRELRAPLQVLKSIAREKLSAGDQLNYDLFRRNVTDSIEGLRFPGEYIAITQLNGIQQDPAETLETAPHNSIKDYEDILLRLRSLPILIDQNIILLRKGLKQGITPPRITLRDVPKQIESQTVDDPAKNALVKPFQELPQQISETDQTRLKKEARAALREQVIPAYRNLHDFFVNEYLPKTRESIAMSDLPDGKAWYAFNVRTTTTTSLSPAEIHQIGLDEVKRIRKQMDAVIASTGFKGSFGDFSKFLRTNSQFYYTDAESLLSGYRDIAKRLDPELARLFGKLPRLPYGVKPVPAYAEQSQTTAYYQPGSPAAGRAGYFTANTYALNTRPKWEMTALTMHEAVPGHHLQIALAQEMEQVPEFRKHTSYTAFVEGWGLYAESLGDEMGMQKDPYTKYGALTYEMWRAIRLVVDTGIHSMGWTRQQAIDYFLSNSSKTEHDVTVEVDRYIVWPGQALAYKIGQLQLKKLRQSATETLGDKFDVRKFHDHVLENGAVPLDVLDARIRDWVAEQKESK